MKRVFAVLVCLGATGCAPGCPGYTYVKEEAGRGAYVEAEQNRKIKVLEAKAQLESAKLTAEAEVEKAKGVAEANKIIGKSLKDNEEYLRWLWIDGMRDAATGETAPTVIYIPTEAGLPILEAGRRK